MVNYVLYEVKMLWFEIRHSIFFPAVSKLLRCASLLKLS